MKKASEVYVNGPNADGTMFYGGWYHVCGNVVSSENAWIQETQGLTLDEEKMYVVAERFKVTCGDGSYPLPDDFPIPAIQLDIFADVPWVLDEKYDLHKM